MDTSLRGSPLQTCYNDSQCGADLSRSACILLRAAAFVLCVSEFPHAAPTMHRAQRAHDVQVRMEVSYRKHLYLPAAMEVHPVNDQAHGKMEQWAPDSEKMQAELEGNRMSKNLSVSPAQPPLVHVQTPPMAST